jgi:hypothetical protein
VLRKDETIPKNPLTTSLVEDSEASNVVLECGLKDSLPTGTLSLETQTMECEVSSSRLTITSKDISTKPIPLSRTTIPESQVSGPSSFNMESSENDKRDFKNSYRKTQ